MKPYASYKPSGVPWLGDVPSDWAVEKLKFFAKFVGGGTPSKDEPIYWGGEIPWVSPKDMKRPFIRETEDYITSEGLGNSPCALIPPCSVLTVVRSGILQHTIPVAINTVPVTLNQDMKALIPDDRMDSRYLAYQIEGCQKELREEWVKQGATVESIEHQRMVDSRLAVPSPDEQQAIADYLDAEIARIDTLIHEKDELIGLLREWRQSVIAEAVTKGLDKTVATKPSGLPWLGDIPSHWDAMGMTKKIASIVDYRGKTPEKVDQGVFLVTAKNIREGFIDYEVSQEFVSVDDYEEVMRRGKPDIGDVLFTTEAPLGNVALVNRTDIALAQRVIKFKGIPQTLDNSFLMYWLLSRYMQEQLSSWSSGSTAEGIKSGRLVRLPLALPPFGEQQAIADYLDTETTKIDDLIAHTHDEITLLKELRAATIADAVLGRIDVRGSAKTIAACA
jgi:type I restriction enzyme S subunit